MEHDLSPAEFQFTMSSQNNPPDGWTGPLFKINVAYPKPPRLPPRPHAWGSLRAPKIPIAPSLPEPMASVEEPWMAYDFEKNPLDYANAVRTYCFEGNVQNDFVVQKNQVRNWYHAPWLHASENGREPLKGLTYERPIPPFELTRAQTHALQTWAIGFYNAPGAATFGRVWADPNNPVWDHDIKFSKGTCVYKLLFTTATDEQVPIMIGSPTWQAVISPQPDAAQAPATGAERNKFASPVRLVQIDWAVVDERSPIGWVFGTYMYNGELCDSVADPWERLTLVGVMWGNDPQYDEAAFKRGDKLQQTWINPEAERLRKRMDGDRPSWGWRGRLNGPADNFISACTSCHGTAQSSPIRRVQPGKLINKAWIPLNERLSMGWFDNVKSGESFSVRGALSADYSLQFVTGWTNYQAWQKEQKRTLSKFTSLPGRRVVFKYTAGDGEEEEKNLL